MHVDAAEAGQVQRGLWQQAPVGGHDGQVGLHFPEGFEGAAVLPAAGLGNRDVARRGEPLGGRSDHRHPASLGGVGAGEDANDVVIAPEEGFEDG